MNEHDIVAFYQKYSPGVLTYLKSKLPHDEAKEILNDVFLEAVDSLPTLQKQTNLKAWLYKIAHNKMVDFYRKKKIKSFLLSQVPYLEILANEIHQPEFILEKNKIKENLESAMHNISEKYRSILRMHYEEHMPVKKIAVVLNLTPKATESLLFRARQSFMKAYERT